MLLYMNNSIMQLNRDNKGWSKGSDDFVNCADNGYSAESLKIYRKGTEGRGLFVSMRRSDRSRPQISM